MPNNKKTKSTKSIKPKSAANTKAEMANIKSNLGQYKRIVEKKNRCIDRAMGTNISHRILQTDFVKNTRFFIRTLIISAALNCITLGLQIKFQSSDNQKIERFISGYYYPYARDHGMTDNFSINAMMFACTMFVVFACTYKRNSGLNASRRAKLIERDMMRTEHIKNIAYGTNIDCAGLDNMYTELDDKNYRLDVLKLARGLAYQDAGYLADFIKRPNLIQNKQIGLEIIRGHLLHNPKDIIKLQPLLIAKYIPTEIRELYWEYKQSKNRMEKYKVGAKIKKQMRQ